MTFRPRPIEQAVADTWPLGFRDLPQPPTRLFVAGELPDPATPVVAIVGTRHADEEAVRFAFELAGDAARSGYVVVSGGARGVDRAAHAGALDANGKTVVVMGGGFDHVFPQQHTKLFEEIVACGGAVVSEYEAGFAPVARNFLERNRLVAAWAEAVVVVQAPARSGALSTARVGLQLCRLVYAVPASPWDPRGAGAIELLKRGALPCASWRDVHPAFEAGALEPTRRVRRSPKLPSDRPDSERILAELSARPRHVDEVVRAVHLPAPRVQALLLELMLGGFAEERGPGHYVRMR